MRNCRRAGTGLDFGGVGCLFLVILRDRTLGPASFLSLELSLEKLERQTAAKNCFKLWRYSGFHLRVQASSLR